MPNTERIIWNQLKTMSLKKYFLSKTTSKVERNDRINKYTNSQFSTYDPTNVYDPYDLKHLHGLRNRLFKTFNEFANILENALLPPVLKVVKKVQIKIKEHDQQANKNYISDLNTLFSEIKIASKNEKLQDKKNKTNVAIRKMFQIQLIQCYKLAITTTKLCSKTLEAGIYNPIQCKMKNMIQIVSGLSSITGKYLYGELFKKKKKESFDLVQRCNSLMKMLGEIGYEDTEYKEPNSTHMCDNTLNELSNKALIKNKTKSYYNSNQLSMYYDDAKPKLGSFYARKWSQNKEITNKYSYNSKIIREKPVLLKQDSILNFDNAFNNTNLECPVEELNTDKTNKLFYKDIEKESAVYCENNASCVSNLATINNVKLYIVKENVWRKFYIKNVSQNGRLLLNISEKNIKNIFSYKEQFKQYYSSTLPEYQVDTISTITESVMDDLINEVLSKIEDGITTIIKEIILKTELLEL